MRTRYWLLAALLAGFGVWHFAHSKAPDADRLEPLLRSYLERGCSGDFEIKQLDDLRVGDYSQQAGGWPVYANHVEVCETHDRFTSKMTNDGGHDADRNIAVAFARRTWSGRIELYTPEIYQAAQQQMQQMLNHAFDHAKVN